MAQFESWLSGADLGSQQRKDDIQEVVDGARMIAAAGDKEGCMRVVAELEDLQQTIFEIERRRAQSGGQQPGAQQGRQTDEVVIQSADSDTTILYRESHALVIGAVNYQHNASWNNLLRVRDEVHDVAAALRGQGFDVETVIDPSGDELRRVIHRFVLEHGFTTANADNRLLVFFSGHGHTRPVDRGYLVPVDAPDPNLDELGFLDKALDMIEIMGWARRIEAKHALFVFDSCFSGTLFETKARPRPGEAYIRASTAKPVRQFITAGDAGQEVPAKSIFTPLFLEALEGKADTNDDGYVTGIELGLHLIQKVPDYNPAQTPQYGKILDVHLDDGDFVFAVPGRTQ